MEKLGSTGQTKGMLRSGLQRFRSFYVLLGKQLWRMLTKKESLLARIYKSRYFVNSDPLNADLGSRPSYVWRSIHEAHELVKKGRRMLIGNGQHVLAGADVGMY